MDYIELELWRIFSYYSLHDKSINPLILQVASLRHILQDSNILDSNSKFIGYWGGRNYLEYVKAVFASKEVVTFSVFLKFLTNLARLRYPKHHLDDECLKLLLMEHILPLACRSLPLETRGLLKQCFTQDVAGRFKDVLRKIFVIYSSSNQALSYNCESSIRTRSYTQSVKEDRVRPTMNKLAYSNYLLFMENFKIIKS